MHYTKKGVSLKLNFRRGSAFATQGARKYLADIEPEDIKKITVIRHAAIGDFMNLRPFLIELREFFPHASITLSVLKHYMYGIPYELIDDVHIMHRYKDKKNDEKATFFTRVKEAKQLAPQDIIFDLTDSTISVLLVTLASAKLKIGYPYRNIRRFFYDMSVLRSEFVLEADTLMHMLNILGKKTKVPLDYGYKKQYPKNDIKRIVYFAGASLEEKCWEKEKFKILIENLSEEFTTYEHIVLQGIGKDEKFLEIYKPLEDKNNVLLQEVMPIEDVMQFLSDSRCLVSNDTGVRNMAIALETPTVGIFFATSAFRYWPREAKHDCVFNLEKTSPDVISVFESTKRMIVNLYEK